MSFFWLRRRLTRSTTPGAEVTPGQSAPPDPQALFLRGLSFASGEGTAKDYVRAAQCYIEAAQQDHGLAQSNLAALYERGQGVRRDETTALMWLTKSANLGNAAAQYRLGVHEHVAGRTRRGESGSEGRIEALKWVRLSATQGYREAENACEFVALSMTREEVAEGERRAAEFVPGPGK
jgi:TPR repeat protein